MRVRCLYKTLAGLPADRLAALKTIDRINALGQHDPDITPGREYVVYGMHSEFGNIGYYLMDDEGLSYPIFVLAVFFEVIDGRMSRIWRFRWDTDGGFTIWPEGWFREYYHDSLAQGDPEIVADFTRGRVFMDEEESRGGSH